MTAAAPYPPHYVVEIRFDRWDDDDREDEPDEPILAASWTEPGPHYDTIGYCDWSVVRVRWWWLLRAA